MTGVAEDCYADRNKPRTHKVLDDEQRRDTTGVVQIEEYADSIDVMCYTGSNTLTRTTRKGRMRKMAFTVQSLTASTQSHVVLPEGPSFGYPEPISLACARLQKWNDMGEVG